MTALPNLISAIFNLISTGLFIYIIMGLLIQFNVVNLHNQLVNIIYRTLGNIFEPVLNKIRSFLPAMNGLDLSPIVLFLAIHFFNDLIVQDLLIPMMR